MMISVGNIGVVGTAALRRNPTYRFANPEAQALVSRFAIEPNNGRKALIDTLVGAIKSAGIWAKFDALYIMAAHDSQAARQNWIAAQYNLTPISSPVFTADRGYQGDSSSSYLDTGFNPATALSPKFVQNSAHLCFVSRTSATGSGVDMGNTNSLIITRQASTGNFGHRCNAPNSGTVLNDDGAGRFVTTRNGPSGTGADGSAWRNGVRVMSGTGGTSEPPANSTIRILGRSGAVSYSARQAAAASFGSTLSDTEIVTFDAALLTFLTAVGAA